ncbi:hypothetical protein IW262DRAFT_1402005 [Armillaria fumosa]|nr:hypothetical protein IW262DRAFT_1402005 [Armillaria fumosa]
MLLHCIVFLILGAMESALVKLPQYIPPASVVLLTTKEAAISQHTYSVAWTSEFYEGTKLNRTKKKPVTVPQSSKLKL